MSVQLRPMRDDEFAAWLPRMRESYARDMSEYGGLSPEAATAKAAEDIKSLFPGEVPSPEQLVFVVEEDGESVGQLWLAKRDEIQHSLYVYELHVEEAYRGRGYGKAAMLLAEDEALRRGLDRLSLSVSGGNTVARRLYQSLGYAENAVWMTKTL